MLRQGWWQGLREGRGLRLGGRPRVEVGHGRGGRAVRGCGGVRAVRGCRGVRDIVTFPGRGPGTVQGPGLHEHRAQDHRGRGGEAERAGHLDQAGRAAGDPGELHRGLRAGERRVAGVLGDVPLDDGVQPELAGRAGHGDQQGREQRGQLGVVDGSAQAAAGGHQQRQHQQRFRPFTAETAADEHAQAAAHPGADRQPGQPQVVAAAGPQQERQVEGEEPDQAAQHQRGAQGHRQPAERAAQPAGDVPVRAEAARPEDGAFLTRGGVDVSGQVEGEQNTRHVDDGADPQHPRVADVGNVGDTEPERGRHRPGHDVDQGDPGVDLHQGQFPGGHPRDDRAAGHPERPGQHQQPERQRVDRHSVEGARELPGEHAAGQADRGQGGPAAIGEPVQHRADHRCQQDERHHRDQQVQGDFRTRLTGGYREEK